MRDHHLVSWQGTGRHLGKMGVLRSHQAHRSDYLIFASAFNFILFPLPVKLGAICCRALPGLRFEQGHEEVSTAEDCQDDLNGRADGKYRPGKGCEAQKRAASTERGTDPKSKLPRWYVSPWSVKHGHITSNAPAVYELSNKLSKAAHKEGSYNREAGHLHSGDTREETPA